MSFGVRPWEMGRLRPDELLLMEATIKRNAEELSKAIDR